MNNRDFKGVWICKEIWTNKELSLVERCLLTEINSLDNEKHCFATNKYFADFLGVSTATITRSISQLEKNGYIKIITKITKNGTERILISNIKTNIKPANQNETKEDMDNQNDERMHESICLYPANQNDEHNNTSKINKDNNTIMPQAAKEKNPDAILYNKIYQAFILKNGKFTNYAKEGQAIKGLIAKAKIREPDNTVNFMGDLINAFWKLKQGKNKFWKDQPFLPSALNASGIFDRVLETFRKDEIPEELKEYYKRQGIAI